MPHTKAIISPQDGVLQTSVGEHYVGIAFNPGGHGPVDHIKRIAAELIDYVLHEGRDPRCTAIAVTNIEQAAMWAVKSVTKQERI